MNIVRGLMNPVAGLRWPVITLVAVGALCGQTTPAASIAVMVHRNRETDFIEPPNRLA